jgi:hypothetical protein
MNIYWKQATKIPKKKLYPKIHLPNTNLSQLTAGWTNTDDSERFNSSNGRSWKSEELRLKSNNDLHKLWYVLLKEKLALKSDNYHNSQQMLNKGNVIQANLGKVMVSMARLKTVISERDKLKNDFMTFLEFWYINKMQKEEQTQILKQKEKNKKAKGAGTNATTDNNAVSTTDTDGSVRPIKRTIKGALEGIKPTPKTGSTDLSDVNIEKDNKISVLDKKELKIVKNLKQKYNKRRLLNKYVENYTYLKGKEKNKVVSMIQKTRAGQAKQIFEKEMAALSYKLKHTKQSNDPRMNKLENLI